MNPKAMDTRQITDFIIDSAKQAGLDDCGIAPAYPVPVNRDAYEAYINKGMHSDMAWLKETIPIRFDPSGLLPNVKTVIVGLVAYGSDMEGRQSMPEGRAFISRYAWGKDYHFEVKERLNCLVDLISPHIAADFRVFVDTGPVFEKAYAAQAGLGFIGKNTLLIHPVYGSFVFLGVILTTLEAAPTPNRVLHVCGTCTRCIDACPANALKPYSLDANRCIGHINNMYKGTLQHVDFKGNLFGCDTCQDICPYNKKALPKNDTVFLPENEMHRYPDPAAIKGLSNKKLQKLFKGTPVAFQRPRRLKEIADIIQHQPNVDQVK